MKKITFPVLLFLSLWGIVVFGNPVKSAAPPAEAATPIYVVGQVRNLLAGISRLPPEKQDEGRLFFTDEYRALSQFCQENIAAVVANWDAVCKIPIGATDRRYHCPYQATEDLLLLSLCSEPSQFSFYHTYMNPEQCFDPLASLLHLLISRKETYKYETLLSLNWQYWSFNYYRDHVQDIMRELVSGLEVAGDAEMAKRLKQYGNGDLFYISLSFRLWPNPNGTGKIPFERLVNDPEFSRELFYTLAIYSFHLDYRLPTMKGAIKRPDSTEVLNQAKIVADAEALERMVLDYPEDNKMKEFQQTVERYDMFLYSYSAEQILLNWLQEPQRSVQNRRLIIDVLWHGLYAEDQVERFLPMLLLADESLRARAWENMPDYLKKDVTFDPGSPLAPDEFARLSDRVRQNAESSGKLMKVVPGPPPPPEVTK